jgi:hypothetical protein
MVETTHYCLFQEEESAAGERRSHRLLRGGYAENTFQRMATVKARLKPIIQGMRGQAASSGDSGADSHHALRRASLNREGPPSLQIICPHLPLSCGPEPILSAESSYDAGLFPIGRGPAHILTDLG